MSPKLVTVVGATGQQGRAVIAAFANHASYRVRGLTRNPDGAAAKELSSQGIEMVKADINDVDSVKTAFQGSHIIFAVTDFYAPFHEHGPAKAKEMEYRQGVNMAKAASATSTLEHYIWSTLPKGNAKYPVFHFESKFDVHAVIESDPALLAKTTFMMVCFYGSNLQLASFRPYWLDTIKKYVQFTTYSPETNIPLIGDVNNITPFVKAIVEKPELTKNGAVVIAAIGFWTATQWVGNWAAARGKEVQLVRISRQEYDALFPWPRWSGEFALMMDYFECVPLQDWVNANSKVLTAEDLQITPVQSLEEWAKSYELPDANLSTI